MAMMPMPMQPQDDALAALGQAIAPAAPEPEAVTTIDDIPPALDEEANTEEKRQAIGARLLEVFAEYRAWRRANVEPMWEAMYEAYHGTPPADNSPYGSYYCIREIFRQVESLKPMLAARMLPPSLFRLKPRRQGMDFDKTAEAAAAIMKYHITTYGSREELLRWLDNVAVWGTSYIWVGWKQYKHTRWKIGKLSVSDNPGKTAWKRETEEVPEEGPCLRWLDHWSVYTDWRADRLEDAPAVFVVEDVTAEYLKTLIREGDLDAKIVKEELEHGPAREEHNDTSGANRSHDKTTPNREGYYQLIRAYTNDGRIHSLLNGQLVQSRRNELGWLPIIELRDYPQPGEHYGMGEPGVLLWDQALLNDAASMWVDSIHYALNPMMVARKDQEKNINLLAYKPGGVLFVDGEPGKAIMPLAVNNTTFQLDAAMTAITTRMQLNSGMTDAALGESKHRTATGIVRLQDAAAARIEHKITWFLPQFKKLYSRLYELEARFLDDEVAMRVEGQDGKSFAERYGPEVFVPEVDVDIVLPPEELNPSETRMKWIQFWQMVGPDPRWQVRPIQVELAKAFDIPDPYGVIAEPHLEQRKVFKENAEWAASGILPNATPHEDQQTHIMGHQQYVQTDEFRMSPPQWQQAFMNHMSQHGEYMQMMMKQAQQTAMMGTQPVGPGGPVPGVNTQTEAAFGNGNRGAAQQGVNPGAR